ncbi:HlyD family type I secretion periplasmic adaptor subunit [Brucella gallinifaecis]|uniref:Membrane fusion protein (MFP) family protein n=1 Tax=Brucella gallinifaecis TaxID=215590 RepID=A0A502BJK4_9HYPH|nr:HlyD family type I secretion periplasmic adaptor subunit [Brucella gallinifaecis]TPF74254.1 HlyD family type I secretion periplasmic adaptor subunit [Brucella gallinifaecis]
MKTYSSRQNHTDNAFLPAALEILETPASPVRVAFIWFICLLATGTLLWTWFGTFDIVATAQGKIQPTGRVKIIQSLEAGRTRSVAVHNGMSVRAGDVLVELDDTEALAGERAAKSSLQAFRAEVARRQAFLNSTSNWSESNLWSEHSPAEIIQWTDTVPISDAIRLREQKILSADLAQLGSALRSFTAQRLQRQAEIDSLTQTILAQSALVKTLSERVDMRSALVKTSTGSRAHVINALQQQQEASATLASQQGQLGTAKAALEVATSEGIKLLNATIADYATRLSEAERRVDELEQQFIKARKRRQSMKIESPIDGTVQLSSITTVGQVITAGAELMRIVPKNDQIEIEAYLPNRDAGFVLAGQPSVIKIEAYPFTRFGVIEGSVTNVATDTVPEPDAAQLESTAMREPQTLVPTGNVQRVQNLVFPITVKPNQATITVNSRPMPLIPGMAVTVEVKTGKRRILEYLFSPLVEITSQAMQEF